MAKRSRTLSVLVTAGLLVFGAAATGGGPALASPSGSGIAALALENVGKKACEVNSLGGHGFYSSCTGNGGHPEYWCSDFARWVWMYGGAADTQMLTPASASFYDYGAVHGTLTGWPAVGDAVVYDYDFAGWAAHVGIVSAEGANGAIETVSGDWGGEPGTESQFSSTSSVVVNSPAYDGTVGTIPAVMGMTISGYIQPLGVPVLQYVGRTFFGPDKTLGPYGTLKSPNGRYELIMQSDGNLVEYATGGRAVWASNTSGHPGARAIIQTDGNLVVYATNNVALWASGTGGHAAAGYELALRDDGYAMIYGPSGALWANDFQSSVLPAGQSLRVGQQLVSQNGLYVLTAQSDGNVVETTVGHPLWATSTVRHFGEVLLMQGDGNLVVYAPGAVPVWSSGTGGHARSADYRLELETNGELAVVGPSGVLWASRV